MPVDPGEALSVSAAARLLASRAHQPAEDRPAPEPAAQAAPEPAEGPAAAAEPVDTTLQADPAAEAAIAAEAPSDGVVQPDPAEPAIEAPHSWGAEHKARFAELPRDIQQLLAEQEQGGVRATNQAIERAAEARKEAEAAVQAANAKAAALTGQLDQIKAVTERAAEVFKSRWDGVTPEDWVALSRQSPDQYVALKAQYDADQAEMQRLTTAKQNAEAESQRQAQETEQTQRREHLAREAETLKRLVPEFADPKKAEALVPRIIAYAKGIGATDEQINAAGAMEYALAYRAMLADEARAALIKPAATTKPQPARPALRPGGAPAEPRKTHPAQALDRLAQTGSRSDALAAMKAMRQSR